MIDMRRIVILTLIIAMTLLFGCAMQSADETYNITDSKGYMWCAYPIQSLDIRSGMEGSAGFFVIGVAGIKTEMYYYFYVKQPDGSLKLQNLKADYVSIFEDDRETPRVECMTNSYQCKMYVPANTIKREFNINLDD
jgi:hypothetical protein